MSDLPAVDDELDDEEDDPEEDDPEESDPEDDDPEEDDPEESDPEEIDDDEDDPEEIDDDVDGNRAVGGLSVGVLDYLARSIVDDADAVDIEVEEGRRSVMLRLHVSPSDMGRVIGRRGRVAQAIRTVVRAAGAREGVDTSVDIVD